MGQATSKRSPGTCECVCLPGKEGRCVHESTIDVPDEAVQAGSIQLNLVSSPPSTIALNQLVGWTDLGNDFFNDFSQLVAPESVHIWDSLVRLCKSRIGQKPHQLPPIYAYCKSYQISLVVRVYLTPWGGRFQPHKSEVWRHLEKVLLQLVNRWKWEEDEVVEGTAVRIFENKVRSAVHLSSYRFLTFTPFRYFEGLSPDFRALPDDTITLSLVVCHIQRRESRHSPNHGEALGGK